MIKSHRFVVFSLMLFCVFMAAAPPLQAQETARIAPQAQGGIPLNCIFAGHNCDPSRFGGCLILFPPGNPALERAIAKGGKPMAGAAQVRLGAKPTLVYEFTAAPPGDRRILTVDQDTKVDDATANALGFASVTIMKGNYRIDPTIGRFGGATFDIVQQSRGSAVPQNPFEQVGRDHNDGLRAVISKLNIKERENKQAVKTRANSIVADWLRTNLARDQATARFSAGQADEVMQQASRNLQGPPPTIDPVKRFGAEAGGAYNELLRIVNSASSAAELDQRVSAVEARIVSRSNDPNFAPVLVAAAVMRNSAHFWTEEFPAEPGTSTLKARIKWWKIVSIDAVGAVAGFLSGGLVGSVPGAIAGGLGASVGELISES